jgi:formiminotetrahydrofolate cyclodeaminase
MNTSISLQEYITDISSSSPTPGGGNVSAFCGVLACSLGIMVCNLTIGKKKYADVEGEIKKIKDDLENFKNEFITFAEEDNKAFNKVMDAFKLLKETEEQKKIRSEKIEEATLEAATVPADVIDACRKVIPLFNSLVTKGNRNSISDAGVAASLISTAAQGAHLNVLINVSSLANKPIGDELLKKSELSLEEVKMRVENILSEIKNSLIK